MPSGCWQRAAPGDTVNRTSVHHFLGQFQTISIPVPVEVSSGSARINRVGAGLLGPVLLQGCIDAACVHFFFIDRPMPGLFVRMDTGAAPSSTIRELCVLRLGEGGPARRMANGSPAACRPAVCPPLRVL